MPLMRRLREDERGTSVLILVFMLVVLLGFGAFAVDLAGAWALKRQDQSAADTGALAAGLFTAEKTKAAAIADATTEVIRITYNTVDPDMTSAQWATEWINCTDPSKPAIFTEVGISDCISFSSNLGKIRVQTPDIPWPTAFGSVLGVDEIQTTAFAEVDTEFADNGGVMPFAMPGNAAGSGEICLKTGPNPNGVPPCDGPDTGNFGFADFTKFGDPEAGIPSVCSGGNDRLEDNIALGIDHILSTASVYPPVVAADVFEDVDACNDGNINAQPWNFDTQTGNVAQALDDGLVDVTSNGVPGRLRRMPPSSQQENVRGHVIDDTMLSWYLNGAGQSQCGGTSVPHETMITCLQTGSGVMFRDQLAQSPRFGWVPLVHEWDLGPGGGMVTIDEFRPVYIQTTFWGCSPTVCDIEFDPDPSVAAAPGPHNPIRVEAASAIQIPLSALPPSLRDSAPGTPGQVFYLLSR